MGRGLKRRHGLLCPILPWAQTWDWTKESSPMFYSGPPNGPIVTIYNYVVWGRKTWDHGDK
ncbi:hypothetical protein TorRG33x02_225770, partial [Trema orientale]